MILKKCLYIFCDNNLHHHVKWYQMVMILGCGWGVEGFHFEHVFPMTIVMTCHRFPKFSFKKIIKIIIIIWEWNQKFNVTLDLI